MIPFKSCEVASRFEGYPARARRDLLALRELVFNVAQSLPEVGEIEETLKWGEPAYLTKSGAGSTIRIDWKAKCPQEYAMYFNCKTTLVETFRALFPHDFTFVGNRALLFSVGHKPPQDALRVCIMASLTYHSSGRSSAKRGA